MSLLDLLQFCGVPVLILFLQLTVHIYFDFLPLSFLLVLQLFLEAFLVCQACQGFAVGRASNAGVGIGNQFPVVDLLSVFFVDILKFFAHGL